MPRPSYARFARGADEGVRPYTSNFKLRLAGGWPILCNYCKGGVPNASTLRFIPTSVPTSSVLNEN